MTKKQCLYILLAIGILSFTLRFIGSDWGRVTGESLTEAGYKLPSNLSKSTVVTTYIYDEQNWLSVLRNFKNYDSMFADYNADKISFF